jgi:hypothetical protein
MVTVDPYEGKLLSSAKLRAAAYLPPVLAGGLLYVLTDDGKLTAWR